MTKCLVHEVEYDQRCKKCGKSLRDIKQEEKQMDQYEIRRIQHVQEMDQARTSFVTTISPACWSLYSALVEEGFSQEQAMDLVKEWLRTMFSPTRDSGSDET